MDAECDSVGTEFSKAQRTTTRAFHLMGIDYVEAYDAVLELLALVRGAGLPFPLARARERAAGLLWPRHATVAVAL